MLSSTNETTMKLNNQFTDQLLRPKHNKSAKGAGVYLTLAEVTG